MKKNTQFNWHRTTVNFWLQKDYVIDEDNNLVCDILRFEFYNEDTMAYFNLTNPLPPKNVSNGKKVQDGTVVNKKDYKEFYTPGTQKIVEEWYSEDIDFFGFTFEGPATKNIWNVE